MLRNLWHLGHHELEGGFCSTSRRQLGLWCTRIEGFLTPFEPSCPREPLYFRSLGAEMSRVVEFKREHLRKHGVYHEELQTIQNVPSVGFSSRKSQCLQDSQVRWVVSAD